jgi:hypothetical protein
MAAADTHSTIEELSEAMFSVRSVPRPYIIYIYILAADTHLLKLQRMQNKVLRTIGNFPRCTPVRDLHTAFNFPYEYNYITE